MGEGGCPEKILSSALWTPEHRSRSFKRCRREPLKYIGAREIVATIKDSSFDVWRPTRHAENSTGREKSCSKRLFSIWQMFVAGWRFIFLNSKRICAYLSYPGRRKCSLWQLLVLLDKQSVRQVKRVPLNYIVEIKAALDFQKWKRGTSVEVGLHLPEDCRRDILIRFSWGAGGISVCTGRG